MFPVSYEWSGFGQGRMALGGDVFNSIGGNLDLAIDDYLAHNVNYLRVILGVKLPPFDSGTRL